MAVAERFELGKSYDFTTLAPTILNASYKNMRVVSTMLGEEAISKNDVVTIHEVLKSYISGLPDSIADCFFIEFVNQNGTKIVLAKEYIDPYSIVPLTKTNAIITALDISNTDLTLILNAIKELGINVTYTTKTIV